jgi:hypothetical protein
MKNNAKIIFWGGAILILIIGLLATYLNIFGGSWSSFTSNIFTNFGLLFLVITIFCVSILFGLPFLKKEK